MIEEDRKATKYAIYLRKSTDDPQKQVRAIEDQRSYCIELANREVLNVVGKPIEEERSAKTPDNRPKFTKLLKQIEKGEINGIISWHPDRISRNMIEAGKIVDLLDRGLLVDMRFVSFPFSNDASGKLMLNMMFSFAKHYTDKLSDDVSRGIESAVKEGKSGGQYKPGYFRDPDTSYYHPDKDNFEIVKKAWRWKLKGVTHAEIVERMNDQGYARIIKKKQTRMKRKQQMTTSKLSNLFKDPIYYGLLIQADYEIDLTELYQFEPMITEEEFRSINKRFKDAEPRKNKHNFPFRQFIACAECGNFRVPAASLSRNKEKRYLSYRCDTFDCGERGKGVRARKVIDAIHDVLENGMDWSKIDRKKLQAAIDKLVKERIKDANQAIRSMKGQRNHAETQLNDMTDSYLEGSKYYSKSELQRYESRTKFLKERIQRLESKIDKQVKQKEVSVKDINNTLNTLKKAPESFLYGVDDTKDRIAKIIFLNTLAEHGEVASLTVKKPFDDLINHPLIQDGGPAWT